MKTQATHRGIGSKRSRRLGGNLRRPRLDRPRAAVTLCVAGLALVAQMVVAAHAVYHLPHGSADALTQSCAICVAGQSHADLPVIAIASSAPLGPWTIEAVRAPDLLVRLIDDAFLARGPPPALA